MLTLEVVPPLLPKLLTHTLPAESSARELGTLPPDA